MTAITEVAESSTAESVLRQVKRAAREAKDEIAVIDRETQRFVRKRPLVASLTALVAGFAIGRMLSRI